VGSVRNRALDFDDAQVRVRVRARDRLSLP